MKCKYCGCTDKKACFDGCYWIFPNICSNCGSKMSIIEAKTMVFIYIKSRNNDFIHPIDLSKFLNVSIGRANQILNSFANVGLLKKKIIRRLKMRIKFEYFKWFKNKPIVTEFEGTYEEFEKLKKEGYVIRKEQEEKLR